MLSIRFEEENYIVNETAGTVTVCVERVGRTADPIMVTINAAESSPSDASGTVTRLKRNQGTKKSG